MRREGHQHGMVRTCMILPSPLNPRPNSRVVNQFESQTTAGLYRKVQTKPTSHSKFTGKCGKPRCEECHSHPVCKSKSKAKGTQKLKSCDVAKNHRLIAWRVVDKGDALNLVGKSASGILSSMSNDYLDEDEEDDDDDKECSPQLTKVEIEEEHGGGVEFCNVGFALEQVVEDEDWCIVGEF